MTVTVAGAVAAVVEHAPTAMSMNRDAEIAAFITIFAPARGGEGTVVNGYGVETR